MRSPGQKKRFRRSRPPALPMNLHLHLCPKMSRHRFAPGRFPALPIERTLADFAKSSCWYPKSRFSPHSKLRSTRTRSGNHRSSQNRPRAACPPGRLAARPNPGSPDNLLDRRWLRAKTLALRGQHDKSRAHRHRDEGGHYRHGDHASLHALIMLALLANMLRSDVPSERLITQVRRRRGAAGHSPLAITRPEAS